MVNLVSLELVELSDEVFSVFVETLPPITSHRVERMLLACVERDTISPKDFFEPLSKPKANDDGNIPFPNLSQFALQDFFGYESGPPDKDITNAEIDSPSTPAPAPSESLTPEQEQSLLEAGNMEITYDLMIDHHGLDVKLPRYY
ncbi:hypothetical protein DL93DRAFT_2174425 [Clavulina sp. PMI_390]|nr:hypothetical protein DL93DRAFT_2174425 [Clavulina sp. PMI_390]